MFNKKIFILLFLTSLLFTILTINIIDFFFKASPASLKLKSMTLEDSNRSTYMLIQDLNSSSPLVRREAILAINNRKDISALEPLFTFYITSQDLAPSDISLISKTLYKITDGRIIGTILDILNRFYPPIIFSKKKGLEKEAPVENKEIEKLPNDQLLKYLTILENLTSQDIEKQNYNLDFLTQIIEQGEKDAIDKILFIVQKTGYENTYSALQKLYGEDFFNNIPIIRALTKIIIVNNKNYYNYSLFLEHIITEEMHPNIQQEAHISLFMIDHPQLSLTQNQLNLIRMIAGLNSHSLNEALYNEEKIYNFFYKEDYTKYDVILDYFLNNKASLFVRERLLNICYNGNYFSILKNDFLKQNIQNRYINNKNLDANMEIASLSLEVLAKRARTQEDIKNILNYITDKRLSDAVIHSLYIMENNKVLSPIYNTEISQMKVFGLQNLDYLDAIVPLAYKLEGVDTMLEMLKQSGEQGKSIILNALENLNLKKTDQKAILDALGQLQDYSSDTYKTMYSRFLKV